MSQIRLYIRFLPKYKMSTLTYKIEAISWYEYKKQFCNLNVEYRH